MFVTSGPASGGRQRSEKHVGDSRNTSGKLLPVGAATAEIDVAGHSERFRLRVLVGVREAVFRRIGTVGSSARRFVRKSSVATPNRK